MGGESDMSKWVLIISEILIAISTTTVIILAIWGDWVRSKLAPPKLRIQPHSLRGTVTRFTNGPRVIYYHLKLVNLRSWILVKNCRVLLRSMYRRGPNQQFAPIPLSVPPQFVWAPAGITPPVITLSKEQVMDFGRLVENESCFKPVLYSYANNFQGFIQANEAVRYCLEIIADGYTSKRYHVFEVAWNGKWSDNLDQMSQNLTIQEITEND